MQPREPNLRAGILMVLPNWLGDVVMSLPALDLLAAAGAPVHVAVRGAWAPLLQGDPRVAGALVHERGRRRGLAAVARLAAQWRRVRPGAVLVGPPSFGMAAAAALASIPVRVGHRGDARALLLTHRLDPPRPRGRMHFADEMARLARELLAALGLAAPGDDTTGPRLPALARLATRDLGPGPPAWVLGAGATFGPAKSWPRARCAEWLELAVNETGARVLVLGDAAAAPQAAALRAAVRAPWREDPAGGPGVVDLIGRTGLLDAAAILKAADLYVGNDSGLTHLAAALGTPTIALFGSSSPRWTAPRGARVRVVTATGFACQPCFRRVCNQPRFCLDAVSAASVHAAAVALARGPVAGAAP